MELDFQALRQVFLAETDEGLATMEEHLLGLEQTAADRRRVDEIFRVVHTLKGDAGSIGLDPLSRFAHLVEDALDELRERRLPVPEAAVELLLEVVDRLRGMLAAVDAGEELVAPRDGEQIVAELLAEVRRLPAEAASGRERAGEETPQAGLQSLRTTLRVDLARLDQLLDLTGEIGVARGRLEGMLVEGTSAAAAIELHRDHDRLFAQLQELVMQLRMVPVGPTFRRFRRTVHDLARAAGRRVRLELVGEQVEIDARVIEKLRDPLLHLVRNAVDHGIEPAEERSRAGKEATGVLTLSAWHSAGHVLIEVADDGRGLDRERILARGRELGLVETAGPGVEAAALDALVLEPGFSTASRVTSLSGRGVGLDVVRRNVEALRGSLSIVSRPGQGCRFEIRIPLTLAVIDGITVRLGSDAYVLPQDSVEEIVHLPADGAHRGERTGLLELRGGALPYHRLDGLLGLEPRTAGDGGAAKGRRESVVVVRHQGRRAGLVIDAIEGQGQTVVRRLGAPLARIAGLAGSAILGDGRVALILDVPGLLATSAGPYSTPPARPVAGRAAKETP